MKAQFSQDHIQPVAVQQPHFQLHIADQASRIVKSPEARKPDPDSQNQSKSQPGISSTGGGPGPPLELSPEQTQAQNRLDIASSTLHQLVDLFDGVLQGMTSSGYDPASTRNNQRLLKGAVSIAKEILSHAQANGKALFRLSAADLNSRSITPIAQAAVAAYGKSSAYVPKGSRALTADKRVFELIQTHVVGSKGLLADLQDQADNGPYTTDRVRNNLNRSISTLNSLQDAVQDALAQPIKASLEFNKFY